MTPGARGWFTPGGGGATAITGAPLWRGTTVQVCGLWPFSVGVSAPLVGVPLGRHLQTGAAVCGDPISWFTRAKLIHNPSAFVLGKPGLGKSSLVRHIAVGLAGYGVTPLVLGDLKGEYVDLVEALGGQVIRLARGAGRLNVLDPGESVEAVARLSREADRLIQASDDAARAGDEAIASSFAARADQIAAAAAELRADALGRRLTIVSALITVIRRRPPSDRELAIIGQALRVLDRERGARTPVLRDLIEVIRTAPDEVREVAVDRGELDRYRDITEELEASLVAMVSGGRLGEIFGAETTTPMRRDAAVAFDVSGINESDSDLQAAVLLACWSTGFASVEVGQALADAGLEPRRNHLVVLDELWRALRAGEGMVDRIDALTRLNRAKGVGQLMVSHTMSDLLALPSEADRMKAQGFVERAGMVFLGGLPAQEMGLLTKAVPLTCAEQAMITAWQDPPSWDPDQGREAEPPGRGKFLLKVGGRPGIPFRVELTESELGINDTNKRWA